MFKRTLKLMLSQPIVQPAVNWFKRHDVVVLMYHGFYDEDRSDGLECFAERWCSIASFKEQVAFLKRNYSLVSLEAVVTALRDEKPLPRNAAIITMDDGYESNYSLAYEILDGVPFTVFVATDLISGRRTLWPDRLETAISLLDRPMLRLDIDGASTNYPTSTEAEKIDCTTRLREILQTRTQDYRDRLIEQIEAFVPDARRGYQSDLIRPLSWEQVRELGRDPNVSIGSHSVTHPNLTLCSDEQLVTELGVSKSQIEEKTGKPCPLLCYPGGAYDERVKRFVEEAGYECGLAIEGRSNRGAIDRFAMLRVGVSRSMDLVDFVARISTS